MAVTQFPNGVSSFGVPMMGAGVPIPATTGKYFFVDSATGSNGNSGLDALHPVATVDYAVGLCTANKGDIILVMPGHEETIVSATSLVVDVAGVSIMGLGQGLTRPKFDFDNTAGSIEMDAANTRLSNVVLRASVSAVVVGINVDNDDVTLDNLETTWEATGDDFITMIDVDAFDRCTIRNCKLVTEPATAGCAEAIRIDDSHNAIIVDNWIAGNFSDACIIGEGAASTECLMATNHCYNSDTTVNNGIILTVATTGILSDNRVGTLYASSIGFLIDPGSMLCMENYCSDAVDETGIIQPATTPT